mmetsp:Transcript_27896/g.61110  ORF Transcript_27896/g.61110 Transcript_27896/m.61110 type:complete len:245 (-) Transcript_27896:185-919(-)
MRGCCSSSRCDPSLRARSWLCRARPTAGTNLAGSSTLSSTAASTAATRAGQSRCAWATPIRRHRRRRSLSTRSRHSGSPPALSTRKRLKTCRPMPTPAQLPRLRPRSTTLASATAPPPRRLGAGRWWTPSLRCSPRRTSLSASSNVSYLRGTWRCRRSLKCCALTRPSRASPRKRLRMSSRSSRRATRARFASCARWTVCSSGAVICCAERACRTAPIGVPSAAATSPSSPIFMRHLPKQAKQT